MKQYDIHIRVTSDNLETVIGILKDTANIISLKQCEEEAISSNRHRFVGGKRKKGISGEDLVLEVLSDGKVHPSQDFEQAFIARGFAPSSAASTLSKAVQSTLVDRVGPYHYCKAGALIGVNMTKEPFTVVGQLKKEK